VLAFEEWRPNFKPTVEKITKAIVWLRLLGLPMELWERDLVLVLSIAAKAGKPVQIDICTIELRRGGFARACVEVDLTKPLVERTLDLRR